ncbi:22280_t:CDS:2 [Dentiscutata erythropus]|uniref:22280_t:CDS:1 n=1 Tax=Dentiscutata erythropus TaxID=1348616 RepID=A0A9N9IAF1_9GLOM|nr:22280_t:CDS:2 [Dentiscutata erythropus]
MSPIHERAKSNQKFIKRNQNLTKKISSILWLSSHQKQKQQKQLGSRQLEPVAVIDKNLPVPDIIGHNLNGLTNGEKVTYFDDKRLANDFKIGIITLLHRPKHRSKDKISMEEIILAIPSLKQKIKTYRPKFVCFNGMAAYEAFIEHEFRSTMNVKNKWKFGLQSNIITWDATKSQYSSYKNTRNYADLSNQPASGYTKIFVCMSTSGRIMNDQRDEQINHFKELMILLNTENDLQNDSEFPDVTMVSDIGNQDMKNNNFDSLNSVNDVKNSYCSDNIEEEIIKLIRDFQNEFEINYYTKNPVPYFLNDQNIRNDVDDIVSCDEQERIKCYYKQSDNKELCDQRDFTPPKSFKAIKW